MTIHADQLPPELRRRLGLDPKGRTRKAPSKAGTSHHTPTPGTCQCGQPFPSYAAWERHTQPTGHTRWNLTLEHTP